MHTVGAANGQCLASRPMQNAMLRLDRVLRRRRGVVLALWLVALVAAVPFAMRQSDHLTGGGYGVDGSESKQVEDAIGRGYDQAGRAELAAVLVPRRGAEAADVRRELRRVERAVRATPDVALKDDV